jgi:TonB family protein
MSELYFAASSLNPMTRLTKKCLGASAVTHGFLLLLVILGAAFIRTKPKFEPPAFELVPLDAMLIDDNLVGGGNPSVTQMPERPAMRQVPQSQRIQQSNTPTRESENTRSIKRRIEFDANRVVRRTITPDSSHSSNAADGAASEAQAEALAQRNAAVEQIVRNIQGGVSGSTSIELPGPGGQAYVGYAIFLKKLYEEAWIPPTAARDNEPIVSVEIVVAKDGRVLSSRILKASGNSNLDRSVESTLKRVKEVHPLPEGSTDEKRTFKLNFNLTTKLQGG